MIVKIHIERDKKIFSIIDSELLGKKLENENKILDLTSEFYKGKELTAQEIVVAFENVTSAIFVGKESIEFALEHDLCEKENVEAIQKIPFVHSFFF